MNLKNLNDFRLIIKISKSLIESGYEIVSTEKKLSFNKGEKTLLIESLKGFCEKQGKARTMYKLAVLNNGSLFFSSDLKNRIIDLFIAFPGISNELDQLIKDEKESSLIGQALSLREFLLINSRYDFLQSLASNQMIDGMGIKLIDYQHDTNGNPSTPKITIELNGAPMHFTFVVKMLGDMVFKHHKERLELMECAGAALFEHSVRKMSQERTLKMAPDWF